MRSCFLLLLLACSILADAQRITENVFIITIDGLRWQELFTGADSALMLNKHYATDPLGLKNEFWAKGNEERRKLLMPFFWNVIAREGQLYGNRMLNNKVNCTNQMWFSYPGYSEILCGFADDQRIKTNNKIDNPNVSVLEFLNNQHSFRGKVAAFCSWDVFPYIINESRSGIPVNAGFRAAEGKNLSEREIFLNELQRQIPSPWSQVRHDAFTHHYALEYVRKNQPRVVYISFGETDDFAHDGKYDAYLRSAKQTDSFIRDLWEFVQHNSHYRGKTTFIITTDHGRGTVPLESWMDHHSKVKGADQIWIAVIGPDTPAKGEMRDHGQYYQNQVAKTVAAFLGFDFINEKRIGEVIRPMMR